MTAQGDTWVDVGPREIVVSGRMVEIETAGRAILLYDLHGVLYATQAVCSHHAAWLSEGHIDGDRINCPRHQGQFHIPTGGWRRGPACADLATYAVSVESGRIRLAIPPA